MNRNYGLWMLSLMLLATGCKEHPNDGMKATAPAVRITTVQPTSVGSVQGFSGTVEEMTGSVLSFMVSGTLKNMQVSPGDKVSKGQLVAEVDDATLHHTHDMAATALRQAEDACRRMKQLHDAGSLPEIQWIEVQSKLEQAQAAERIARKNLNDSRLYAPFNGVIAEKNVEAGQNVMPGMPVVKLVTVGRVKVKIAVPENEISHVSIGQPVTVRVSAPNGAVFEGKVTERGIVANAMTRSYEVKALIDNPNGKLLPGMICDVSMPQAGEDTVILLPASVVQTDNANRHFVWTSRQGKAHRQFIRTGVLTDGGITVTAGLSAGDEVLTEGQQKVSEGMDITVIK